MKTIHIKLTRMSPNTGPFEIYDQNGKLLEDNVSVDKISEGVHYNIEDDHSLVRVVSKGSCICERVINIGAITSVEFNSISTQPVITGCIWRHLDNQQIYNSFYGHTHPYIIEYPFSYQYQDEILQSVKEYTKVGIYGKGDDIDKMETDDIWYNKAIIYNGQQCSGLLELVPKPKHNLRLYNSYPIYRKQSKEITFTKSDNFYNYNTFWNVQTKAPAFKRICKNLSIDKELIQENMDYTSRSFRKQPIRAKDLKIRHILDNRSDAHMVSQFIITNNQKSYK